MLGYSLRLLGTSLFNVGYPLPQHHSCRYIFYDGYSQTSKGLVAYYNKAWWVNQDLNLKLTDYESGALPIKLLTLVGIIARN